MFLGGIEPAAELDFRREAQRGGLPSQAANVRRVAVAHQPQPGTRTIAFEAVEREENIVDALGRRQAPDIDKGCLGRSLEAVDRNPLDPDRHNRERTAKVQLPQVIGGRLRDRERGGCPIGAQIPGLERVAEGIEGKWTLIPPDLSRKLEDQQDGRNSRPQWSEEWHRVDFVDHQVESRRPRRIGLAPQARTSRMPSSSATGAAPAKPAANHSTESPDSTQRRKTSWVKVSAPPARGWAGSRQLRSRIRSCSQRPCSASVGPAGSTAAESIRMGDGAAAAAFCWSSSRRRLA